MVSWPTAHACVWLYVWRAARAGYRLGHVAGRGKLFTRSARGNGTTRHSRRRVMRLFLAQHLVEEVVILTVVAWRLSLQRRRRHCNAY